MEVSFSVLTWSRVSGFNRLGVSFSVMFVTLGMAFVGLGRVVGCRVSGILVGA